MDDIKRLRREGTTRAQAPGMRTRPPVHGQVRRDQRQSQPLHDEQVQERVIRLRLGVPKLKVPRRLKRILRYLRPPKSVWARGALVAMVLVLVAAEFIVVLQPHLMNHAYALGAADALLQQKDDFLTTKLVHDPKTRSFNFNKDYMPQGASDVAGGGAKITAVAYEDPLKGVEVTDPVQDLTFTIKPKFQLLNGQQDGNRIVYPLLNGTGWLVYTMSGTEVKEDIVLSHANGDKIVADYTLDLGDSFEARLEEDGSVGVYASSSPLTGQVNTGSDKDAELLQKARHNSKKDKLFFSLPTPTVFEANRGTSAAVAHYELKDKTLKTITTGLRKARYPLTIDPTVTVTSTSDVFRDTNPDSNAKFDSTTGGDISRGAVTGGVIGATSGGNAWTTNTNRLATNRFLHSTAIYDDYVYAAGGSSTLTSTTNVTTVEFAKLSSSSSCSTSCVGTWATTTALPVALSRFQLLVYNGYLYAIGGSTTDTTCGTVSSLVYYNRIQVNGQLTATWSSSSLPAGVCGLGASFYSGKLYVAGGRTGSATSTGVTTVAYATVNPNGSLTTFTTSSVALPAARYDLDLKVYNGYLYILGGLLAGTPTATVLYAALASDGSVYGSSSSNWLSTDTFANARSNMGVSFSVANYGFMYLMGGCKTFSANQTCNTSGDVMTDVQVAQINADGSLGTWTTVDSSVSALARVGAGLNEWRGYLFTIGGCTVTSATTVSCTTGTPTNAGTQSYAPISSPGQVSPKKTNANALPTALFGHGSVVNNGFIYVVGGCTAATCETATPTTGNISYATLNSDGTTSAWTTDSTNRLNGATGLAAFSLAVYNNYLYATGGYTKAAPVSTTYYVQLNANGSLVGAWTSSAAMAQNSTYHSSVAYRGFLFVFGGCTAANGSIGCSNYIATVYRFTISASTGALSGRTTTGLAALPVAKALMAPALYNGYMYLAGGATGAAAQTSNVYYAKITDTGTIASWSTATGVLAHNLRRADATAMNGYLYVFGGHDAGGPTTYGDIQLGKMDLTNGNITSNFTSSIIQITPRWDTRAVYSNGYMYVTGGCSTGNPPNGCSTISTLVEYAELFNAGNKNATSWTNANTYATNRTGVASVAYNGYIYVAGGCATSYTVSNSTCNGQNATVNYAVINPDGTLGTWTTSGNSLPSARAVGCLAAVGNTLYHIGGELTGGVPTNFVEYSPLTNGVPGAWVGATKDITNNAGTSGNAQARGSFGCATYNNRIYVTGGEDAPSSTPTNTVFYSPDLSAGGDITTNWNAAGDPTAFTTARFNHQSVIVGGKLYVFGGQTSNTAWVNDVQFISINPSTGNLTGSWAYATDLPSYTSNSAAFAANGYVYLIGGRDSTNTCTAKTIVASVNSTGTLSNWSTGATSFTTARMGSAGVYNNGYYYMLGGNDCAGTLVAASQVQYGGLQSQLMKTLVSKYADFSGDGTPWNFVAYLTQAVNSGVDIEKWRMTYKSSDEVTNSWGVTTTINPLNTDVVNTITAYNGAGTNVKLTRWFYVTWDFNQEQSFTFTDDTQPNINQYELYYSAATPKRLMHGRDFRDQTQQDLDAHP